MIYIIDVSTTAYTVSILQILYPICIYGIQCVNSVFDIETITLQCAEWTTNYFNFLCTKKMCLAILWSTKLSTAFVAEGKSFTPCLLSSICSHDWWLDMKLKKMFSSGVIKLLHVEIIKSKFQVGYWFLGRTPWEIKWLKTILNNTNVFRSWAKWNYQYYCISRGLWQSQEAEKGE